MYYFLDMVLKMLQRAHSP